MCLYKVCTQDLNTQLRRIRRTEKYCALTVKKSDFFSLQEVFRIKSGDMDRYGIYIIYIYMCANKNFFDRR